MVNNSANENWEMINSNLKVAIVHDWLVGGGAERVVEELHRMFPDAPIYTSYATREWRAKLDGMVVTGFLQHWPFSRLRKFLPMLRIWWFSRLKFDGYDLVISSSGAEAKGIKIRDQRSDNREQRRPLHINYCHAPTHYYWARFEQYLRSPGFGLLDPLARLGLRLLIAPLRRWDKSAARRPDIMVANSTYTKSQIKKYYGRDAIVIHPPVNVDRFRLKGQLKKRHGFVTAGRQVPYKRFDLPVKACSKIGRHLTVIGNGPDHDRLCRIAGPRVVTFLTTVTDEQLPLDFQKAEAFIFADADDFGITAVEAMAAGTPVIAYQDGGALDYVIPGKTGEFFKWQTPESLSEVLKNFDSRKYDPYAISRHAEQFSPEVFQRKMRRLIEKSVKLPHVRLPG